MVENDTAYRKPLKRTTANRANILDLPQEILAHIACVGGDWELYGRVAQTCKRADAAFTHCPERIKKMFDHVETVRMKFPETPIPIQFDGKPWRKRPTKYSTYIVYKRAYTCHREGGLPAIQSTTNGTAAYIVNGKFHRDGDEPAYIVDGKDPKTHEKIWVKNGNVHRPDDKPAIVRGDGIQIWLEFACFHRGGDKPAIMVEDGYAQFWFVRGEPYRECRDQPTGFQPNGDVEWRDKTGELERLICAPNWHIIFKNGHRYWIQREWDQRFESRCCIIL